MTIRTGRPPRRSGSTCGGRRRSARALDDPGFDPSSLVYWRKRLARSARPHRVNDAVQPVVEQTGIFRGRRRRAVDSTILADAVATQDTVTRLISAIGQLARPSAGQPYGPRGPQRGCLGCGRRAGNQCLALADQPGLEVSEPIGAAEAVHDQAVGTPHCVAVDRAPRGVQVDLEVDDIGPGGTAQPVSSHRMRCRGSVVSRAECSRRSQNPSISMPVTVNEGPIGQTHHLILAGPPPCFPISVGCPARPARSPQGGGRAGT